MVAKSEYTAAMGSKKGVSTCEAKGVARADAALVQVVRSVLCTQLVHPRE